MIFLGIFLIKVAYETGLVLLELFFFSFTRYGVQFRVHICGTLKPCVGAGREGQGGWGHGPLLNCKLM